MPDRYVTEFPPANSPRDLLSSNSDVEPKQIQQELTEMIQSRSKPETISPKPNLETKPEVRGKPDVKFNSKPTVQTKPDLQSKPVTKSKPNLLNKPGKQPKPNGFVSLEKIEEISSGTFIKGSLPSVPNMPVLSVSKVSQLRSFCLCEPTECCLHPCKHIETHLDP